MELAERDLATALERERFAVPDQAGKKDWCVANRGRQQAVCRPACNCREKTRPKCMRPDVQSDKEVRSCARAAEVAASYSDHLSRLGGRIRRCNRRARLGGVSAAHASATRPRQPPVCVSHLSASAACPRQPPVRVSHLSASATSPPRVCRVSVTCHCHCQCTRCGGGRRARCFERRLLGQKCLPRGNGGAPSPWLATWQWWRTESRALPRGNGGAPNESRACHVAGMRCASSESSWRAASRT